MLERQTHGQVEFENSRDSVVTTIQYECFVSTRQRADEKSVHYRDKLKAPIQPYRNEVKQCELEAKHGNPRQFRSVDVLKVTNVHLYKDLTSCSLKFRFGAITLFGPFDKSGRCRF